MIFPTLLRIHDYVLTNRKEVGVLVSFDTVADSIGIAYLDDEGFYDPDPETAVILPRSAIIHIISNLDDDEAE